MPYKTVNALTNLSPMTEKIIDNLAPTIRAKYYMLASLVMARFQNHPSKSLVIHIPAPSESAHEQNLMHLKFLSDLGILKQFKSLGGYDYTDGTTPCEVILDIEKFHEYFENLERKCGGKKSRRKGVASEPPEYPFKNLKWEWILIQFLSDDRVSIAGKGVESVKTDYKEMGFEDTRNQKPDNQWTFLRLLAKNDGELTSDHPDYDQKYKKTKQLLSTALRHYFGIKSDPFYPYKDQRSYRLRSLLTPSKSWPR